MDPGATIQLMGVATVCGLAMVGAIGVTVRFALMPLIKARRQGVAPPPDTARLDGRMDALEEEVRQLGSSMQRLAEAVEFDAQLRAPQHSEPARLPGAAE